MEPIAAFPHPSGPTSLTLDPFGTTPNSYHPTELRNVFQGILLGFLAYALFATHDASVKGVGTVLPVFEIGLVSGLSSFLQVGTSG